MALSPPTRDWLLAVLAGERAPAAGVDWAGALRVLAAHRLEGAALACAGELPDGVRAALAPRARRAGLATTLAVEAGEQALAALGSAGIPGLLFKGAALVRGGLYADPSARAMDDADLLVPEEAGETAFRALAAAGFRPWSGWTAGRSAWLDSAALFAPAASPALPTSIDLHWRVAYGGLRFGSRAGSPLWEGADPAGMPAPEPHLVVVAEHVVKHARVRPHPRAFGDVRRLAAAISDWDRVVRAARAGRVGRGVGWVLDGARAELGAPIPGDAVRALTGGARAPRALTPSATLEPAPVLPGRVGGIGLRWRILGGPGAVAGDLADAAFPGGSWLRARYGAGLLPVLWARYAVHSAGWLCGVARSPASPNQELF